MKITRFILSLLLFISPLFAVIEKSQISDVMKEKIDTVTLLLQDKNVANEAKHEQIFAIFDPVFDYSLMAKLSLSKQWKRLSKDEQKIFKQHFEERLKKSYIEQLNLYTDEVVAIKGVKQVKSRIHLQTELIGKENNYQINYKFYNAKKRGWMIYDVDILGVSIIQTYRTQFDGFLDKHSFKELIKKLDETEPVKE